VEQPVVFATNRVAASPSHEPDPVPSWVAGATSAIRAAESRTRWAREVAAALGTLPPDQRSFVQLSYFDGLPHAQIAEQARLPVASVSHAIAAGMQQLARALERA
jgi:RNA polymerase sigma factor (sigma-70 family)